MLVEALLLSLIFGLIFGGKLGRLKSIHFKYPWIIFLALFTRYLPRILDIPFLYSKLQIPSSFLAPWFFILSYVILLFALLINTHYKEVWLAAAGTALNFLVVALNRGFMPVSEVALRANGFPMEKISDGLIDMNHILSSKSTRLLILGDIIPLAKFYPLKKIISIGDIILCVGVFLFVFLKLRRAPKTELDDPQSS